MAGPGPIFSEAHRLRRYIEDLDTRAKQAPRQLQVQKAKLQAAEDNLKKAQDEIKQLKVKIHDREVSVKSTYQQIDKWKKQSEGAGKEKELDALKHEIDQATEKVKALEDEIFEAMSLSEDKAAQLPAVEAITKQVRADVALFEKDYDARLAKWAAEKATALEELKAVDAQIPPEVKSAYDNLVKARGADSMSKIEGRICTACYTELTPQNAGEVIRGMFVMCKSCGRIVYS